MFLEEVSALFEVRRGSYGSPDPSRKGGSDEGEEKPEKRACGELDMEGCIFFRAMSVPFDGEYQ